MLRQNHCGVSLKLLLDVDDCIGEYGAEIVRFVNRYGRTTDRPEWTIEDLTDFDSFGCLGLNHLKDRFHQHLIDTEYCRNMPVMTGAQEFVDELRGLGTVVFVTSPHSLIPAWANQREAWLMQHFDADKDDIVHTSGKHHVFGDYLIDDKIENCAGAPLATEPLLFDKPWNRSCNYLHRVCSYNDVLMVIGVDQ